MTFASTIVNTTNNQKPTTANQLPNAWLIINTINNAQSQPTKDNNQQHWIDLQYNQQLKPTMVKQQQWLIDDWYNQQRSTNTNNKQRTTTLDDHQYNQQHSTKINNKPIKQLGWSLIRSITTWIDHQYNQRQKTSNRQLVTTLDWWSM